MDPEILDHDWRSLMAYLPTDLESIARLHGFVQRSSGRQNAETWLRLLLMHAAGGLSLSQTVSRARARGWAEVSSVALHKRLGRAGPWLQALSAHLLKAQRATLGAVPSLTDRVLRVVDATDIQESGATGTDWRLHYSLRLPDMVCDHFELTDAKGVERLGRFAFEPSEVVLADRGYCHREGVANVLDALADVVVRLVPSNFPLMDEQGEFFDVLAWCAKLQAEEQCETTVWFEYDGWQYPLRLCVLRKPDIAVAEAQRKLHRKSSRKGTVLKEHTLQCAAYVMILTSLSKAQWSTAQVLNLYRCRWQIELAFKRLKTLLQAGHVPKSNDPTAKAWMQAKVLTALLIETLLCDSRSFSPCSGRLG